MKSYKCPACGEKLTKVIQWQTISVAHEFDLVKKEWKHDLDRKGGNHETFTCRNCGEDLPEEIENKIFEII